MNSRSCEAAAMAFAVFEDDQIPPCDGFGEFVHENGRVEYRLCEGCDEALRFVLDLGRRLQ